MTTRIHNDMNWIGLNISFYRRKRGMKQKDLAEAVDISNNYMSEIETGKKIPATHLIFDIADVLEVEVHKLFEEH